MVAGVARVIVFVLDGLNFIGLEGMIYTLGEGDRSIEVGLEKNFVGAIRESLLGTQNSVSADEIFVEAKLSKFNI